jgi:hypothetical protein
MAFTLHHLERNIGGNPIQWAIASSNERRSLALLHSTPSEKSENADNLKSVAQELSELSEESRRFEAVSNANTIVVPFKGTNSLLDVVIDAGGVPMYASELGLQVHGTMWASLHSSAKSTADQLLEQLEPFVHRSSPNSADGQPIDLILTGHSLGGGFALLVALELIARGMKRGGESSYEAHVAGAEATSGVDWRFNPLVLTFGAPMVVVPDTSNELWNALNERAFLFVNAWDIIPRMPSAEVWLFDVLPRATGVLGSVWGAEQMAEKHLRPAFGCLETYDTCGTMIFLDNEQPGAFTFVASDGSGRHGAHREMLNLPPPSLGSHVIKHHDARRYINATANLDLELRWRATKAWQKRPQKE